MLLYKCPYGLLLLLIVSFTSGNSRCQTSVLDQKITFSCHNCSISEALKTLEREIDYFFSYSSSLFTGRESISLDLHDLDLRYVLDSLIKDTTIKYNVIEKQIVLYRPQTGNHIGISDTLPRGVKRLKISGKIVDNESGSPLPFANISIVGKSIGSVANLEGEFILQIPSFNDSDSIGLSCIGYKTLYLSGREAEARKLFRLETEYVSIQEVIIRNNDPQYLIKTAIRNIPENYAQSPSLLTSFYRETSKKGDKYLGITEAVLQTYKPGYYPVIEAEQIKVVKGRKTQNFSPNDSIVLKLKAGLYTTILLDIVKSPAEFLQEENFWMYDFRLADIIIDDDQETYLIEFKQKENIREPLYRGKIYIDIKNLAFKNFDFQLNPTGIERAWERFVVRKPSWLRVRPVRADYRVSYRQYGGHFYLNFVMSETEFRIRSRRQLFSSLYSSKIEMAVTQIDTTDIKRFRSREIVNIEGILTEQFSESAEIYWTDYNFIKPDEPLEEALKNLR